MLNELPQTITELHSDLQAKKYSCVQLIDAYLGRITAHDPLLNAFITVTSDYAYEQAKKCDELIANNPKAFEEFPLLGVPVALKDLFMTKGIRTTAGSNILATNIAQYSATSVQKVENAGAIAIGKTNLDAWGHGSSGENSDFNPTRNPWNQEYIPGGSSSGSAVSVAAQFSMLALGTDTGGSVRNPASRCNIVGLKPTYGAISRYGVIAMASSLDTVGEMAATVEDVEKIFTVLKGPDGQDATVASMSNDQAPITTLKKIGVPKEYFAKGLDPEVEEIVRNAIKVYEELGHEIVEVSLPNTKHALSVYYIIQPAEVSSNLGRYDGVRMGNDRWSFGDEAKRRIMLGTYVLSAGYHDAYYNKAMQVRTLLIKDLERTFEKVDALITPVAPTPPTKIGEKSTDPLQLYLEDIYSVTANLAGIPALAIPGGFTKDGLPVGYQLMGPRFSEYSLFALGKAYQQNTDWHSKKPNL